MRILRGSRYAFAITCRYNDLYFELFHGIFLLFHIHLELISFISIRCLIHLALFRPLIPIWSRNLYRLPAMEPLAPISAAFMITLYPFFSSSSLISSYLLVLYSWLCFIRLSYDIDNPTTMILTFTLDRRIISSGRPVSWYLPIPTLIKEGFDRV